jgi:hypothetical protein
MDAMADGTISSRPRTCANGRDSQRAPLRKNFRSRVLSYIGNGAGRRERVDGAIARERVDRAAIKQAQRVFRQLEAGAKAAAKP